MTIAQAEYIKDCIDQIYPIRTQFSQKFYADFFDQVPEARRLFSNDMHRQEMMLFAVVSMTLKGLESGRGLDEELAEFGRVHTKVGVEDYHFPIFGAVFLETLISFLPRADHARMAQAWWRVYTVIYESIVDGMRAERANAASERSVFRNVQAERAQMRPN